MGVSVYFIIFFVILFVVVASVSSLAGSRGESDNNDGIVMEEDDVPDGGREIKKETEDLVAMEEGLLDDTPTGTVMTTSRQFYSVAHDDINSGRIVYIHVDVEDGGPECGLLQLSAVITDKNHCSLGEFNSFIRPPADAVWNEKACQESHGYTKDDPRISSADSIVDVWPRFVEYVEKHLDGGRKVGMMLAWNGKGSDCAKLFHITEVQYAGVLFMPKWIEYFCDPCLSISGYKACMLHESKRKSKQPGYGLGTVYMELFGVELVGAHDSLNDCKAQVRIVAHDSIRKFIDRKKSVCRMENVWAGKQKRNAELSMEPTRAVPHGWEEGADETFNLPSARKAYLGHAGGGIVGPSSFIATACALRNLADLFLFFITMAMLEEISKQTNKYGN
jgi:hypothetical protein